MLYSEALTRLQRMTSSSSDPGLTSPELADLLSWSARTDDDGNEPTDSVHIGDGAAVTTALTSASNPFLATDVGVSVTVEGAGSQGGTLGTTVAAFVSIGHVTMTDPAIYSVSNTDVTLYRPNAEWTGSWSLTRAAAEGWLWQAAKVAARFKFQADGDTFNRDQVFTHAMKMHDEYRKRAEGEPSSIRMQGSLVIDRFSVGGIPWWYDVMGN